MRARSWAWRPAAGATRVARSEAGVVLGLAGAAALLALPPASIAVATGLLAFGAWRLAAAVRPRRLVDRVLLSWTISVAALISIAELLALVGRLGRPMAWLTATAAVGLVGVLTGPRPPAWDWSAARAPLRALHWTGRALLGVFGLQLGVAFVLTWYTGINVYDTISTYLPQSARYLQAGSYVIEPNWLDYFPQLHQTLVAYQLVFLQADVLVNPLSFVTALMMAAALYAMATSVGWRGYLPLVAALVPFTMPLFLMHASGSRFDILEGLWLLLTLYFLRRGYAATSLGWLAAAAMAMGLALATKPTFWFAAPGLAAVWLAVGVRALRRRRARRLAVAALVCGLLFAPLGLPYLVRNYLASGHSLGAPPGMIVARGSDPFTATDYARRAGLHLLAYGTQFLTPPSLLPAAISSRVEDWFADTVEALGYAPLDPRYGRSPSTRGLIRHISERYSDSHASFGAALLLVVLPSIVALPLLRRRLGRAAIYPLAAVLVGLSYFAVVSVSLPYDPTILRYSVEPMILLSVAAPAALSLLPRRPAAVLAVLVSMPLLAEMNDVIRQNRQASLEQVMRVPREEQYFRFFSDRGALTLQAARAFQQKYPPGAYPDVYVYHPGLFPDYTFRGPGLGRRYPFYHFSLVRPTLPGPLLIQDADVVARLVATLDPVVDRLSADTYLLLPRDQLRVVFHVVQGFETDEPRLRLRAFAPADPQATFAYRFVLLSPAGEQELRAFSADPDLEVPLLQTLGGGIRVELREHGQADVREQVRLDYRQFLYQ